MTIASELTALQTNLENAYDAVEAKGGTLPAAQNFDNLATAVSSISTGDEITATNTTGSAVSADDKVWVNGEDVYTQNFTAYGGTVANKLLTITGSQQGIIQQVEDLTFPTTLECVFKVKFTDTSSVSLSGVPLMSVYSDTNSISSDSYRGCQFYVETGDKLLLWNYIRSGSTNSAGVDFNNLKLGDLTNNQWYWFRLYLTSSSATASYSIDGENWTIGETYNYGPNSSYFNTKYIKLGCPTRFTQNTSNIIFDLSECYVKVDGNTVWTPYTKTGTNYSIINDTDITSTSFTGIAQSNIANNAAGSVKTLLDGNGTYAPTTATKSITANGTYTAGAENVYGLSEVTVDVPGGGMDTVEATNNTGSAITNGDKVWVNQSGSSYIIEDYNVYEINCDKYGSPTISNSVASNFSTSNYLLTKNIIDTQSYNSWEFSVKIRTSSDVYSGKAGYGYYFCGGPAYDAGSLNYSFLFQLYHNELNCLMSSNGTSWDIPIGGNKVTISANTDYFLKLVFTGTQYIFSYSTDGEYYTTISTTTSSLKMNNDKISFGKAFANSPDTSFSGSMDFSQAYFIADGVKIWDGYTASGRINAPDTALTGTAAENIAIGGTGDVEIGNVIEPTLGTKTITANGTYNASTDNLDGYSTVTVDVPSAPTKKYNLLDRVKDDNNNEIGTVSGFFTDANNVEYAVVCLDAQYRLDSGQYCSKNTAIITNLPTYASTTWGPWEARETATFNTQKILDYCTSNNATSTACSHCRSKSFTIDGTTYYGQLPNMIELNDIVRNHTALNTADPTASSYSSVNFASSRNVWSSSQRASDTAWFANNGGNMSNNDKLSITPIVIPVLEIPNT